MPPVRDFMDHHFRHFNARETVAAARAYDELIAGGGKMLLAMAGAMSTAELGLTLAEMIRQDKIHAISCTAANLEEDVFNLVAHDDYAFVPEWRSLSNADEVDLRDRGFNRVTDTCIPETVIRHIEGRIISMCADAAEKGEAYFPYEYFYRLFDDPTFTEHYQVPPEHSWVLAAKQKGLAIYTPGWEDSTLGNIFTARVIDGTIKSHNCLKLGTHQLQALAEWYMENHEAGIGFFQIGGGIAGDFAICTVPMLIQDLEKDIRLWQYFAQISDSTTSYGSYSGAVPNEKITWHKLDPECPKFMINSDAAIVAPLIFAHVLGL